MFGTYCYAVRPFFLAALRDQRPSGGVVFLFYVFTGIYFSVGPPGAPSFVARRKIGEKGVPKGSKAALWILAFYTGVRRGDVRRPYEFALVQFTRFRPVSSSQAPHPSFCLSGQKLSRSAAHPLPTKPTYVGLWRGPLFALLPRTRLYCFNCGEIVGTERITSLICSRKLGGSVRFSIFLGTAARRGKGISGAPKPT